jgi:hypothetical protein
VPSFQIRAFTPEDIPQVMTLQQEYQRCYPQASVIPGEVYLSPGFDDGRLSLTTASGAVPLSDTYEPNFERHNEFRRAILEMLNRQDLLAAQIDPVRSLVEQGRIVDAVAMLRQRENLDLVTARQRVAYMRKTESAN